MPSFDTSGLPQPMFKSQVNNQRLLQALEGQVDLDLVPLVEMTEDTKQRLWRETQRTKVRLDHVASHVEEHMIQILVSSYPLSPKEGGGGGGDFYPLDYF